MPKRFVVRAYTQFRDSEDYHHITQQGELMEIMTHEALDQMIQKYYRYEEDNLNCRFELLFINNLAVGDVIQAEYPIDNRYEIIRID